MFKSNKEIKRNLTVLQYTEYIRNNYKIINASYTFLNYVSKFNYYFLDHLSN